MITEIAQIDVKPGSEKDFEAAVVKAKAAFGRSKGFHSFELHKSIEKPQRYRLMVKWRRWKTIPSTSAAPRISPNGAASSASILPRPRTSSIPRPC